jgi:hypothetical protein
MEDAGAREIEADRTDGAVLGAEWQSDHCSESEFTRWLPPFGEPCIGEYVLDFDRGICGDRHSGGPAAHADAKLSEIDRTRLWPAMHDDGAERVGIVLVTKEYGREIRVHNGRQAGECESVDLVRAGGGEEQSSDLMRCAEFTLFDRSRCVCSDGGASVRHPFS